MLESNIKEHTATEKPATKETTLASVFQKQLFAWISRELIDFEVEQNGNEVTGHCIMQMANYSMYTAINMQLCE